MSEPTLEMVHAVRQAAYSYHKKYRHDLAERLTAAADILEALLPTTQLPPPTAPCYSDSMTPFPARSAPS